MISGRPYDHPAVAGQHVVSMTRAYPDGQALGVATCQCGWSSRAPATPDGYAAQDEAVEAHWLSIIAAAEDAAT